MSVLERTCCRMERLWSTIVRRLSYSRAYACTSAASGVVTRLTLDVVPYFDVCRRYDDVPLETAIESLPDVFQDCD